MTKVNSELERAKDTGDGRKGGVDLKLKNNLNVRKSILLGFGSLNNAMKVISDRLKARK